MQKSYLLKFGVEGEGEQSTLLPEETDESRGNLEQKLVNKVLPPETEAAAAKQREAANLRTICCTAIFIISSTIFYLQLNAVPIVLTENNVFPFIGPFESPKVVCASQAQLRFKQNNTTKYDSVDISINTRETKQVLY